MNENQIKHNINDVDDDGDGSDEKEDALMSI